MDIVNSLGMTGKNCVITGATSGLGKAAARSLGQLGANLVLVGRNERAGTAVVAGLKREDREAQVQFVRADLSDQGQVRSLGQKIAGIFPHIDVLINNAGARFNTYHASADEIEMTIATNHLSHFLLTCQLLEQLLRASAARVITISSGSHSSASSDADWLPAPQAYNRKMAYAQSKLANILFAYELSRRLAGTPVTSNAMDPGGMATNLGRNNGWISWLKHLGYYAMKRQLISPRRSAQTLVYMAMALELDHVSGKYFFQGRPVKSSEDSYDETAANKLWTLSLKMTHLDRQIGSTWKHIGPQLETPTTGAHPGDTGQRPFCAGSTPSECVTVIKNSRDAGSANP
jgi:NAD(P)-dependent dehydrogenase (short-subunit alcohol dehydrogenase family)